MVEKSVVCEELPPPVTASECTAETSESSTLEKTQFATSTSPSTFSANPHRRPSSANSSKSNSLNKDVSSISACEHYLYSNDTDDLATLARKNSEAAEVIEALTSELVRKAEIEGGHRKSTSSFTGDPNGAFEAENVATSSGLKLTVPLIVKPPRGRRTLVRAFIQVVSGQFSLSSRIVVTKHQPNIVPVRHRNRSSSSCKAPGQCPIRIYVGYDKQYYRSPHSRYDIADDNCPDEFVSFRDSVNKKYQDYNGNWLVEKFDWTFTPSESLHRKLNIVLNDEENVITVPYDENIRFIDTDMAPICEGINNILDRRERQKDS